MKKNHMLAALLAALLFIGGAIAGILGDRYYIHSTVHAHGNAQTMRERYINETTARVHLSGDQVKQLNTILDGTRAKLRAFREQHRSEFEKINQEQIQQVKAILRPDQVSAYEQLVADQNRRRREHRD